MANNHGPAIRKGGLVPVPELAVWTPKQWEELGDGRMGTGYVGEAARHAYDGLRELFTSKEKKKEGPIKAPPKPEGGYSRNKTYSFKDLDYRAGYGKTLRMAERLGYSVVELPDNVLLGKFGNSEGYERGKIIYVASNRTYEERAERLVHELLAKLMRDGTDKDHESLHPFIEPIQKPFADAMAA